MSSFKVMKPKYVRYARFFCAGAVAASILLDHFGASGFANLSASSVAGIGALVVAKKLALII
jgi:hypothetical protein